jgi:acetyltransferase-like isoleucine patch superfamily enzyme
MVSKTITLNRKRREISGLGIPTLLSLGRPIAGWRRSCRSGWHDSMPKVCASHQQTEHSCVPVVGQDKPSVTTHSGKSNQNGRPALSASRPQFLTSGRMALPEDLVNADVAMTSMQLKSGTSSRMASLVGMIVDFSHIMNAQLRFLGKATAPFSVRLRGRALVWGSGEIVLKEGVSLNGTVVPIELNTYQSGQIEIGRHTFINYGSSITARAFVTIGSYCHLGHYTFLMDNEQHDVISHYDLPPSKPVIVEDNVWVGSKVVILPGVRIGTRAVIGAGSIVTKDIPPRCVAAGNPARVLRYLTELD